MLVDSPALEPGTVLDCDLCIVGGGAVGIALARELLGSGLDVVLLESGGLAYQQRVQQLYRGEESGDLLKGNEEYLASTRLRFFGGTTNHWHGWTRPLDPLDFEAREWMPNSGWPLSREELDPYYERAAALVEVPPFDYPPEELRGKAPFLLLEDFATTYIHVSPPTRFGLRYREELEQSRSTRVILHATLTRIRTDEERRRVTELEVTAGPELQFTVRPRAAVLAAGTIENARLLLVSEVGNERDVVGRYFMDHPRKRMGYTVMPKARWHAARYLRTHENDSLGHRIRAIFSPTEETQRKYRLPNALIGLQHLDPSQRPELLPEVTALADTLKELNRRHRKRADTSVGEVNLTLETVPNRSSRVSLSDRRDPFGVPRTKLEWRLSPEDAEGALGLGRLFSRRMALQRGARTLLMMPPEAPLDQAVGSPHQLGTTRMHTDPTKGVVDSDCRVHGMENLWIGGGSVFPAAGASNPTLTLVALTVRLADHLRRRVAA